MSRGAPLLADVFSMWTEPAQRSRSDSSSATPVGNRMLRVWSSLDVVVAHAAASALAATRQPVTRRPIKASLPLVLVPRQAKQQSCHACCDARLERGTDQAGSAPALPSSTIHERS